MTNHRKQQLAVFAAIGVLAGFFAMRGRPAERPVQHVLAEVSHFRGHRTVEPRVSLSSPWAPFLAGAAPVRTRALTADLLSEVGTIAVRQEPGLTHLLLGHWTTAIRMLERPALSADERLDLSAAYYMRGLQTESLLDFCRALDALGAGADSPEALFNRALILEQLADRDAAAQTWERYLEKDPASAWAVEARDRLRGDRQPDVAESWKHDRSRLLDAALKGNASAVRELSARYPLGSRRAVELELLPQWAAALLRGDRPAAGRALNAARVIVAQRPVKTDLLLQDVIDEIDHAGHASELARAHVARRAGNDALDVNDHAKALELFGEASSRARGAAALDALVTDGRITAHYRRYEYATVDALISSARGRYADRKARYPSLFARLDWLEGLAHIARPDPLKALRSYESALAVYGRLGEAEHQAAQHINQADSYIYLGDTERTAIHVRKALLFAAGAEDPRRLQGILKIAARLALENGTPTAAIAFQNRLVRLARTFTDPMRLPDALVARSATLSRAGRREEALRDLAEVRRLALRIADGPTLRRLEADASTAEAFALRDADDARVVESLSRAIENFRRLEMRVFLPQLLLERGRAHLRLRDDSAAETDFRAGIEILESQRHLVSDAALRIAYLDRADRTLVELAALLLERGRVEDAFDLVERFRSRELLDRRSGRSTRPLGAADIRERMPPDLTLVTHATHVNGLMTFAVTREGIRGFDAPVDERELERTVDTVAAAFAESMTLPPGSLRRLGEILLDRLHLPPHGRVVFVPDDALARVPYAALRQADGSYLVESHTVALSPSATMLALTARPRNAPASIVVVASPERPQGFDDLPPLPRTIAEAGRIARSYAGSRVVRAGDDGASGVLAATRGSDVFHFAGHAFVDLRTPSRSALLIGATGRLTAADIEAADLSHLQLVVLGGCNTGMGKNHRSEGAMSLARAFMAASVPAVMGTIAPIEDAAAEQLLWRFHRAHAEGLDAPSALREAQLRMLRGPIPQLRDPVFWSAFHVAGGFPTERR